MPTVSFSIAIDGIPDGTPLLGAIGTPIALQRPEGHFDSVSFDWAVQTVFAGGGTSSFVAWVGNEAVVADNDNWQLLSVGLASTTTTATSVTVTPAADTFDHVLAWAGAVEGPQKISGLYVLAGLLTTHTTGVFTLTTILASD